MSKLIAVEGHPNIVLFHCPGCECGHQVHVAPEKNEHTGASWGWNGSMDRPTFSPSVLIRSGHYLPGSTETCWCTYNANHPNEPAPFKCEQCHSFVVDGNIQFLGDCSHKLAGQTVPIPDWENV